MDSILVVAQYPEQRRQVRLFLSGHWTVVEARDASEAAAGSEGCSTAVVVESVWDPGFALRVARALRRSAGRTAIVVLIRPGGWMAWTEAVWGGTVDCVLPWPRSPDQLVGLIGLLQPGGHGGEEGPVDRSASDRALLRALLWRLHGLHGTLHALVERLEGADGPQ
ncbi:MAG: hypothetical protein ACQEXJ_09820 [Myxococcota bacterium]